MKDETKTTIINYEFFVDGMHCAACELFVEKTISEHPKLRDVRASINNGKIKFTAIDQVEEQTLLNELNDLLSNSDYKILNEKPISKKSSYRELSISFLMASMVVIGFVGLQRFGIMNLINPTSISLPFIFFVGVVASLSTCMAVVGGLVLSISSEYAKLEPKKKSILIFSFHLSRLISFFILGGLIGAIGSAFTLTPITTFVMNIILFLVMIIMGVNLLDLSQFLNKFQIRIPKMRFLTSAEKSISQNKFTPIILGVVTFFLPCGFTQSMQVYALTTGSFITGASTMLVFALGTLPVLALISYASIRLSQIVKSGIFYKTSGFLVIFFAILNLLGALVVLGVTPPFLNF